MERRNFSRVRIRSLAVVKSRLAEIKGATEDLSLNGVKLKTAQKFDLGQDVQIRILFKTSVSEFWAEVFGVVVRDESDDMVIQFTSMSLDTYAHLQKVISHRLHDGCKVFEEFFAHMTAGSARGPCAEVEFQKLFNATVDQQLMPQ